MKIFYGYASKQVFHLITEEVNHEFAPGLRAHCWGFNGQVHGPTIEVAEGDQVCIYVTNKLPENTTVHWHGVHVPCGMDAVGELRQKTIELARFADLKGQIIIYKAATVLESNT